jgi:hypothetical protein
MLKFDSFFSTLVDTSDAIPVAASHNFLSYLAEQHCGRESVSYHLRPSRNFATVPVVWNKNMRCGTEEKRIPVNNYSAAGVVQSRTPHPAARQSVRPSSSVFPVHAKLLRLCSCCRRHLRTWCSSVVLGDTRTMVRRSDPFRHHCTTISILQRLPVVYHSSKKTVFRSRRLR